jgi:hypothetical protein
MKVMILTKNGCIKVNVCIRELGTRCMIENDVSGDDIVISRYFRVLTSNMVSCAVCVLSRGCCAD